MADGGKNLANKDIVSASLLFPRCMKHCFEWSSPNLQIMHQLNEMIAENFELKAVRGRRL